MKDIALKYLNQNHSLHVGMIHPIVRGTAELFYGGDDGVFLREIESDVFMLSMVNQERGKEFLRDAGEQELFCVYQEYLARYLVNKYNYVKEMTCFQAIYNKKEYLPRKIADLEIKALDLSYAEKVYQHYSAHVDLDYLKRRLLAGVMYGGFVAGELCGFVGTHEEGGIGLLEVFEKYRMRGYGAELESHLINLLLDHGEIPYAQIMEGNVASYVLHEKLGFDITREKLYWLKKRAI